MSDSKISLSNKPILGLPRDIAIAYDPFLVSASKFREIVSKSNVIRSCIQTLIMQVHSVPYRILALDPDEKRYYELLLSYLFEDLITRVLTDMMEVPFGGAVEIVRNNNGLIIDLYHVDGASLAPTYIDDMPYVQIDPNNPMRRAYFPPGILERLMWSPIPDIRNYGWSRTPVMDSLDAIGSLLRIETYWNTLLSDTPPAGILDLRDMTYEEASEWVESVKELYGGISRLKIPIIYDHEEEAKFIKFSQTPVELTLAEKEKRYIESVTGAFGMSPGDLGYYLETQTKAGATKMTSLTKRQGLGYCLGKVKNFFNKIFPSHVRFEWSSIDPDDNFRTERAQRQRADSISKLVENQIITIEQAYNQLIEDGILNRQETSLGILKNKSWFDKLILDSNPPYYLADSKKYSKELFDSIKDYQFNSVQKRSGLINKENHDAELLNLLTNFTENILISIASGVVPNVDDIKNDLANVLRYHSDVLVGNSLEISNFHDNAMKWWKSSSYCPICEEYKSPVPVLSEFNGRPPCLCEGNLIIDS